MSATDIGPQPDAGMFISLAAGEIPPAEGLWVVEYRRSGERLDGWLGQIDWWCGGLISRPGIRLCTGSRVELLIGLDWMLSAGLLIVPGTDEPLGWATQSVMKAVELGVRDIQVGLNSLGYGGNPESRSNLVAHLRTPVGVKVRFWDGGLFDPLRDGY